MTLASATIKIDGDSRDAERALDRVGDEARKLGTSLDSARQGMAEVAGGMLSAEAIMGGLRAGMELARAAASAYAEENQRIADGMATVSASSNALLSSLGGVVLGGDGAAQSMAALSQVMDYFTGLAGENEGALSDLVSNAVAALIDGLVYAATFGNGLIDVFGVLKLTAEALGQGVLIGWEALQGLGLALYDVTSFIAGTAIETFAGLAEGAVNLAETIGIGGLLPEGARESVESLRELGASMQEVPPFAERMAETSAVAAAAQDSLTDSLDTFVAGSSRRQEGLADLAANLGGVADSLRDGTIATDNFTRAQEAAGAAVAVTTEEIESEAEAAAALLRTEQEREKLASQKAQRVAAEEAARLQADRDARAAFDRQAEKDAIQATIDAQADLVASRQDSARAATELAASEAMAVAKGQKSIKDAIFGTLASVLEGKALAALIEGVASLFKPGGQVEAAGYFKAAAKYGAGAIAVRALGGIGGGKGGGSTAAAAGAAPAPAAAPAVNNTSSVVVNNQFGVVGDARGAARQVADLTRMAVSEGYL